jgi:hypothetical protein
MSREKKLEKIEKIVAGPLDGTTTDVARTQRLDGPSRQVGSLRYLARMQHLPSFPTSELTSLNPHSQPYILNVLQSPQEGRVNAGKPKGICYETSSLF